VETPRMLEVRVPTRVWFAPASGWLPAGEIEAGGVSPPAETPYALSTYDTRAVHH
jgi:hypothetical protein